MVVKLGTNVLHWSQPILHQSSPSCSSSRRGVTCRHVAALHRSALFGTTSSRLHRSWSSGQFPKPPPRRTTIRRPCSASLDSSDEEFSKKIQELALRFQLYDDEDEDDAFDSEPKPEPEISDGSNLRLLSEPPDWSEAAEEIIPAASIERRANSVDLPVSLRMIKRKMQWREGLREAGESARCSVKRAFSSMVFIIRELHSFSLQMREFLFYEDLQGVLGRVQKEMHASFVWLFQQVFSHTPTLMVYVMILLANFTVYSMAHNSPAIAAVSPPSSAITESVSETTSSSSSKLFDSSAVKTFSVSSLSNKKTTSIGGSNGGGGGARPVARGMDGDGGIDRSGKLRAVLPDAASQLSTSSLGAGEARTEEEEEASLWGSIVDEAARMEAAVRDEALDRETARNFVSPVTANIESDVGYEEYFKTELMYQTELALDPNNSLLLLNYAQFLYLVAHEHDRAEEYFKRATKVTPPDPAVHSKYATFLWRVRNDLWAAEEAYLEAISADSGNSSYAADYAHFLWNTGGDETCFPLSDDSSTTLDS